MTHTANIKSIFRGANCRRTKKADRRELRRILVTLGRSTQHQNTYALRGGF